MKRIWTHRRLRFVVAGIATLATGAALASAGLAGLRALDFAPAAANQYPGHKVAICHRTHSKKHRWVKIRVDRHALKAHLRHGDFVIDAAHPCPPTSTSAKNKKNKHNHHKNKGKHKSKSAHASKSKHKSKSNTQAQKQHGNGHKQNGDAGNGNPQNGNAGNGQSGKHGKK